MKQFKKTKHNSTTSSLSGFEVNGEEEYRNVMRYNQTVILNNGKQCLLRNCEEADAQAVYDVFMLTHGQTDFLLTYPDENDMDVGHERSFLIEKEKSADEIEICAIIDGKIIGTAGIEAVGRKDKVKHRAEFGIAIEKGSQGFGVGRALTQACIACAKEAGYAQLELEVVANNTIAVSLYERLGFIEYGRNPKGFRSRITGWQAVILMYMELSR